MRLEASDNANGSDGEAEKGRVKEDFARLRMIRAPGVIPGAMIEVVDVGEALKDFDGGDVGEEREGADHKGKGPLRRAMGLERGEGLAVKN